MQTAIINQRVIELTLQNTPGLATAVAAPFNRPPYKLLGILNAPIPGRSDRTSMLLLVKDHPDLDSLLAKLHDLPGVEEARTRDDIDESRFDIW